MKCKNCKRIIGEDWALFKREYYHIKCLKIVKRKIREKSYKKHPSFLDKLVKKKK